MKKLLLILLIFFSLSNSFAQQNVHVDATNHSYDWKPSNNSCYGCGSFYYQISVDRASFYKTGYYTFYVYFYGNSFYQNTYVASTYITGVNFYLVSLDGRKQVVLQNMWFLLKPKSDNFDGVYNVAILYSKDPYQIIQLDWENVVPY